MDEKMTFDEILKKAKDSPNGKIKWAITMKDMPLPLAEAFLSDIKLKYNDIYWVKLQDIMRKAEAYDYIVNMQGDMESLEGDLEINKTDNFGFKDKDEKEEVKTMGGLRKNE